MITRAENITFLTDWNFWRQGKSNSHLAPMISPEQLDQHLEYAIHTLKELQAVTVSWKQELEKLDEWNEKRIDVIGQNGNVGYE